jgi:hypothetical protein
MKKTYFKDKTGIIINDGDLLEGDNSVIYQVKTENDNLVAYVEGYHRGDKSGLAQNDFPSPFNLSSFQLSSISVIHADLNKEEQ